MQRVRNESGAATILIALLMVSLVASAGLAIDISNLTYQRSRVQNSADTAALAIARDCATDPNNAACIAPASTADYFAQQNSDGGTSTVTKTSNSVGVSVTKSVDMNFLRVLGINSKPVSATAKATWTGRPIEGSPVLPMGVPYCMYKNNLPPATTPLLLRTDVISEVFNVIVQGGAVGRLITTLLGDLLGVTESCTSPDGLNLKMLRGPIWLSGLEGALNGILNWNSSICNMHLGTIDGFLGSTISSVIPSNCMNKLGTTIKKGQIILLPVYVPSITLQQLGLEMSPVVCVLGICPIQSVTIPPRLGVKVIGFTPFRITGWNYSGNSQPDPNAPACASINLLTHPSASIGCNGIQGYFLKSIQKDATFTYDPTGADLGATDVRLSE